MEEHRRFNRADFHTNGFIHFNNNIIEFKIINISLNGILVETEKQEKIPHGSDVELVIKLSSSEIEIKAKSKVLHKEKLHLGFRFEEIDLESMIHLRRLVELNSQSPDQIAKELAFLKKE